MTKLFERLIVLKMTALFASCASPHNYKPASGYVPDAETAIKIAVAVWEPVYGKDTIAGEKPYRAKLVNDVWIVEGSLPEGWNGGVALAEISKDNGKVLRISHGK